MADRYCRNCGHELRQDDRFCPSCGRPVHQVAHVPTPEADMPVPPPFSAQQAGTPTQERTRRMGRPFVGGIVVLLGLGILATLAALGGSDLVSRFAVEPTSEEVVQAFRDAGLEVRNAHPLEEDPEWGTGMVPKTEKEGTRFEIPSGGEDTLGDVFTYESREDLEVMKGYWETFNESGSGMFYTHIYVKGNVLIRIDGSLPKGEADEYGEVLERM